MHADIAIDWETDLAGHFAKKEAKASQKKT